MVSFREIKTFFYEDAENELQSLVTDGVREGLGRRSASIAVRRVFCHRDVMSAP